LFSEAAIGKLKSLPKASRARGAAKLKADRAARAEADAGIQRWNDQLSRSRDLLWSPTIRAALLARVSRDSDYCGAAACLN
jgi:hypothetical protein